MNNKSKEYVNLFFIYYRRLINKRNVEDKNEKCIVFDFYNAFGLFSSSILFIDE